MIADVAVYHNIRIIIHICFHSQWLSVIHDPKKNSDYALQMMMNTRSTIKCSRRLARNNNHGHRPPNHLGPRLDLRRFTQVVDKLLCMAHADNISS